MYHIKSVAGILHDCAQTRILEIFFNPYCYKSKLTTEAWLKAIYSLSKSLTSKGLCSIMVLTADWWSVGCEFQCHTSLFEFEIFCYPIGKFLMPTLSTLCNHEKTRLFGPWKRNGGPSFGRNHRISCQPMLCCTKTNAAIKSIPLGVNGKK